MKLDLYVLDYVRFVNAALSVYALVMCWKLRWFWRRLSEPGRLTMVGFGLLLVVIAYSALESVVLGTVPGPRTVVVTIASVVTCTGLRRFNKKHSPRDAL